MEDTRICREQPCQLLQARGIRERLVHAAWVEQIRGRTTEVADSPWLARICEFGPAWVRDGAVQRSRYGAIAASWSPTARA